MKKQLRKDKYHKGHRLRLRQAEQRAAKTTTKKFIWHHLQQSVPIFAPMDVADLSHTSTAWLGICVSKPDQCTYSLAELRALSITILPWDGHSCRPLIDCEDRIFACLARPDQAGNDTYADVIQSATTAMAASSEWASRDGCRSPFVAGVSYGRGQKQPGVLLNSPTNTAICAALVVHWAIRRIVGFTNSMFIALAPDLHNFYREQMSLRHSDSALPHLRRLFPEFLSIAQWTMCKCMGHAHDGVGRPKALGSWELVFGIEVMQPGELSIPCRLMLSKDVNFKMKGHDASSREKDPALGPGWAYMVANDTYLAHLVKYVDQDEVQSLGALAVQTTNDCMRPGLASSSRHEMFRANGTGDLQKGENIMGLTLLSIVASYDIACQWSINFWERAKAMPAHMQLPSWLKIQFKVLKFHLPPHIKKCHGPFSFNYTRGVGRTDGEGNSLLRKIVLKTIAHSRAFVAFSEGLKEGHTEELVKWEKDVRAWEEDSSLNCPYEYPEDDELTMEDVRLKIAEEAHARTEKDVSSKTNNPGAFIMAAMEIEDQQETVRLEVQRRQRTSIQATSLQQSQTLLLSIIKRLRDKQAHFMPGLANELRGVAAENTGRPEKMKLYLPSAWPKEVRDKICVKGLPEEERLRAQARAGTYGRARWHINSNAASQPAKAHTQELQDGIEQRIREAASQYERGKARVAAGLPRIEEEVDEFGDPVVPTTLFRLEVGEGQCQLSWIWYTGAAGVGVRDGDTTADGKLHDASNVSSIEGFPVPTEFLPKFPLEQTWGIVWQVAEISFRFDFCALDRQASRKNQLDAVKACFAGPYVGLGAKLLCITTIHKHSGSTLVAPPLSRCVWTMMWEKRIDNCRL
ncbi:hypothetical protein DFH07DRAFT_772307 [Mycena maculata]|uniref:Uncharacterized protein n=1 Tax=Mycena maculata TaxID=230809 RepID=A0AAD7NFS3_9AGAR|nr:hypothetical protein DFH07DRAFT_772307 [Mycena maculata]